MITFFVNAAGSFGIRTYLATRGASLADRIQVVEYEELERIRQVPCASSIFAAIDQLSAAERQAVAACQDQMAAAPGVRLLNDPRRVLRRYDLLRRLYDVGRNCFTAVRANEDPSVLRYPVFVRQEHHHTGSLTRVLRNGGELDMALGELLIRGLRLHDLLIVEFCDTSDVTGLYRKYSAMKIGDAVLPRHLHASRHWVAKSETSDVDEAMVREELEYMDTNPHEAWLRDVCALAGIDYGRIDYGLYRGEPQVWEINTNPTMGRPPGKKDANPEREPWRHRRRELLAPAREHFHRRFLALLEALARASPARAPLPIVIDPVLVSRIRVEGRARRRQAAVRRFRQAVADLGLVQRFKEVLRPMVLHVAPMVTRRSRARAGRSRGKNRSRRRCRVGE